MALATLVPMAFGAHEFMLYDAFPDNVISVRDIDFNIDMMGTLVKVTSSLDLSPLLLSQPCLLI